MQRRLRTHSLRHQDREDPGCDAPCQEALVLHADRPANRGPHHGQSRPSLLWLTAIAPSTGFASPATPLAGTRPRSPSPPVRVGGSGQSRDLVDLLEALALDAI